MNPNNPKAIALILIFLIPLGAISQEANHYRSRSVFKESFSSSRNNGCKQKMAYYSLEKKKTPLFKVIMTTYQEEKTGNTIKKYDTIWSKYDTVFFPLPNKKVLGYVLDQNEETLKIKFTGFKYGGKYVNRLIKFGDTINIDTSKTYFAKRKLDGDIRHKSALKTKIPYRGFKIGATSIPIKYRFSADTIPAIISTDIFNGALTYSWQYGRDVYYLNNPREKKRSYFSETGFFVGVTKIEFNERNNSQGFEGFSQIGISTGLIQGISLNKIGFSLAMGFDIGTSRESRHWLYNGKPWIGIGIGVSLSSLFN